MSQYIQVAEDEGDEPMEVPVEEDGTLLLTTLAAQFPGSCGLKYRNPDSGSMRGIRLSDGRLYPPDCDWGRYVFIAVFPKENKRKVEEPWDSLQLKTKRVEKQRCSDLIVLGLPWKSTEEDLRKYFSQFGDLLMVQVKKDPKTGQSKGFGFVRFAEYEAQVKCISQRHMIDGRWCDVRIPNSKNCFLQEGAQLMMNRKVFVGRCTEDMTADDLRLHFSRFGEVVDVFIPKPFRAFAFVTFADPEVAQNLCGEDHIIKGASVHISGAAPKNNEKHTDRRTGLNHTPFGFNQAYPPGTWGHAGRGNSQGLTSQGNSMGTNLSNNLGLGNLGLGALQLNHAMLAAAQAVLSSQGGWGPLGLTNQGGSASSGDNPTPNHASANSSFGTVGNGTTSSGSGGGFLGWGGSQGSDGPSHSPGHVGGWGAQTKAGTGWN
ncbi:TAR DNA-binding protein 43-like isoform X2 [Haliotis rufescens]|uniref:TAR DNA-binding protein 43-like isoform X2 n=1 Tax=Haliotis rufescens TaxID=6454 RepID=UPI001EAFC805|nr:TAR DNA-binding protein 43-like isoform X2 [Haliotis rufescens]